METGIATTAKSKCRSSEFGNIREGDFLVGS